MKEGFEIVETHYSSSVTMYSRVHSTDVLMHLYHHLGLMKYPKF